MSDAYPQLKQHTVLYIEDNPANMRLITRILGRFDNIKMLGAEEPVHGLEMAGDHKPDLVLLDINLPGMDGFAVLELLRQGETTCNTPVIAISANAMDEDVNRARKAGFDDYIIKPVNVDTLIKSVNAALKITEEIR